jgi:hypothetical protein
MTSKSTSIGDLPNVNTNNSQDDQETLMVNSILKEIENDDDIDTSENAINYTIDTSQIPPKINEQMPTREIIEETTREMFNEPIIEEPVIRVQEPIVNVSNNIMENELPPMEEKIVDEKNEDKSVNLTSKIIKYTRNGGIILVLFILLSLPQVNKILVKSIPKLASNAPQISTLGIIFKALFMAIIYSVIAFFL